MSDAAKTHYLKQTAVYWEALGSSETGESLTYAEPVEIKCRWDDTNIVSVTPSGQTFTTQSLVFVPIDTPAPGVLRLGTLNDITDEENPYNNPGAKKIQRFDKIPDRKAIKFLRKAYL